MPSMSQMTMLAGGTRSRDQVHAAPARSAVDRVVDDRLDLRTDVLDAARRERLDDKAAQRVWSGGSCVAPAAHRAINRLVQRFRPEAARDAGDVILAEPFVAQHQRRVGIAADG
ncbi:MAG: hypothetical protein IPN48_16225 [Sphingomonadales bacterium]|nr:hypothetical protein [Sphingomonadales bacterium]